MNVDLIKSILAVVTAVIPLILAMLTLFLAKNHYCTLTELELKKMELLKQQWVKAIEETKSTEPQQSIAENEQARLFDD